MDQLEEMRQQARKCLSESDYVKAQSLFQIILDESPDDAEALFQLARLSEMKGEFFQAVKEYLGFLTYGRGDFITKNVQHFASERLAHLLRSQPTSIRCEVGLGTKVFGESILRNSVIGKNCLISRAELYDVNFGDWSIINAKSAAWKTTIGKFTCIGVMALINPVEYSISSFSVHPFFYRPNFLENGIGEELFQERQLCEIGSDVWIGDKVTVNTGIRIGSGAIIKAGSTVEYDVPPYAIVQGSPADIIEFRYDDNTIEQLLKLSWWDFAPEKLQMLAKQIGKNPAMHTDIALFLHEAHKINQIDMRE